MIFAFLSARLRQWILLTLILPLVGRVLQAVGVRVADRNPRAGSLLGSVGGHLQARRTRRRLFGRRRRRHR